MLRSIKVMRYQYNMEEPISTGVRTSIIQAGHITSIISATATVNNMGDPQINVICDLNLNNYTVCQTGYLLFVKYAEGVTEARFTIRTLNINTEQNTITMSAEPMFNELRNSVTGINSSFPITTYANQFSLTNRVVSLSPTSYYLNHPIYVDSPRSFTLKGGGSNGLEMLGGKEFSFIDQFGGEVQKVDSYMNHKDRIGNPNRNYRLKLGANVKGMNVTIDTTDIVNGVLHYYGYTLPNYPNATQVIYRLPSGNIREMLTKLGTTENRNGSIITKNWAEFEDVIGKPPPEGDKASIRANLVTESNKWNVANKHLNDPKINIELDFFTLRNSIGMEDFNDILKLNLGDSVKYYHEPLNWEISARVSGYVYNIITDVNEKITVGNGISTILDII